MFKQTGALRELTTMLNINNINLVINKVKNYLFTTFYITFFHIGDFLHRNLLTKSSISIFLLSFLSMDNRTKELLRCIWDIVLRKYVLIIFNLLKVLSDVAVVTGRV